MKWKERLTSYVVWASIIPVLFILGDCYNLWNIIKMPKDTFSKLIFSILTALVAFGILNNPTDKKSF